MLRLRSLTSKALSTVVFLYLSETTPPILHLRMLLAIFVLVFHTGFLPPAIQPFLVPGKQPILKNNLPLFQSEEPLQLNITVNTGALFTDRGDNPQYHGGKISLKDSLGNMVTLDAKLRIRGHFRKDKKICRYAPILLNLDSSAITNSTAFAGQNKLKLVVPCVSEELIEREYLLYKIYNLITPLSVKARLAKVQFTDSANPANITILSCFVIEPPEQVAVRNGLIIINKNSLNPEFLPPSDFNRMAVFQFFIGNTDWSIQFRQNIELMAPNTISPPAPVPYDFDHSGLVDAPYAHPAEELEMSNVRQRRYRGYCLSSLQDLDPIFTVFKEKRPQIEALYRDNPRLSPSFQKWALSYIADFYTIIDQPKKMKEAFNYPCLPGGTGSVIIKGLKE
ncbi:hypothetical protein [Flavihumibacter profundi]|uniref:hypothetical protein n=1 Tax=Flavihumibacter profundi TaxID=2716883 RepID=UPI001CC456AF|nr:hypothetical protein [Flavihumibacter profundi]MBZ5857499.1 hypothetical protein [Flavihumibacter profundi]